MSQRQLIRILSELPAALLEDFDLEQVVGDLGDQIAEVLGVAGAGVMLEDPQGNLRFVSASDPVLHALERLQADLGEGPCVLAYEAGDEVIAADLAAEDRFPKFASEATQAGMGSVFSFPLFLRGECIGALNVYDSEPHPATGEIIVNGRLLANVAASYLVHARNVSNFRIQNLQLTHALDNRVHVEQAKGWIQALTGLDADASWQALRRYARKRQARAETVARALLEGTVDVREILD